MSAKLIRRVVELFIFVFFVGAFLQIARAFAALWEGRFGTLHWPVQAGAYDLQVNFAEGALITFQDGILAISGQPFWHGVDLVFSITFIGLFIAALMILRRTLTCFSEGELVNGENAAALRKIGLLLLTVCGLSIAQVAVLQPAILSIVSPVDGTILHPSISWDVKGMTNVWLHYDPPIGTFLLAGLAFLFSEAIRNGTAYREDSESVI